MITHKINVNRIIHIPPCQIDFLFSVTCAHVKKLGALNLFIQKLEHQFFLFISEKKNTFHIFQF